MKTLPASSAVIVLLLCTLAGAEERHWAFQPISNPKPPSVKLSQWVRSPVDRFILAKLEKKGIRPSPVADRVTLLRRIYLDLIGLPPGPDDVRQFLSDKSPQAYERQVDRLLRSPHYGERWGRHWLDMARYADSNGYESDQIRPYAWRWRDWVISALNRDLPFDQFTIWQIAGDLLPNATLEQRIATGFHRNTLVNTEGGVDREEDRVKRTVDRTNTIGKVWLGITLGCCQCHSHKYDPFTQKEYYQFYAFFNSLAEPLIIAPFNNKDSKPFQQFQSALARWEDKRGKLTQRLKTYRSDLLQKWEASFPPQQANWRIAKPGEIRTATDTRFAVQKDLSVLASGPNNKEDTYTVRIDSDLRQITAIRLEVMADARLPSRGPGRASNGNFVLSGLRVYVHEGNTKRRIRLKSALADFSQRERQVTSVLGDIPNDGWAIHPHVGVNHVAVFQLSEVIRKRDVKLTIQLDHQTHADHNIGRFRLSLTDTTGPLVAGTLPPHIKSILSLPISRRSGAQRLLLIRYFQFKGDPRLHQLLQEHTRHLASKPKNPDRNARARAVSETRPARATHVHRRGSFLDKGDRVSPNTPAVLPPLFSTATKRRPTRLDLARWLVSKRNPLTSRVIVNRVWQQYFGRGLVASDDDFGTQGEAPSHPHLLDWLATQFRRDGWSLKKLHKRILLSATYRQSSFARPDLQRQDPLNSLLARQSRLRVEAEIVRDLALSVSGLLSPKVGGPSVRPPQPEGTVKLGFQNSLSWPVSKGRDRYRRGMYTFFQRTVPYPMLITFDAADSNASCTRRERSNTPLQALTIWNDPVFVEAARALGRRIVKDRPRATTKRRLQYAFKLCLGRTPNAVELRVLLAHFQQRQRRFRTDPNAAAKLLEKGNGPDQPIAAGAAWTSVARLLLNLDEFITRE